MTATDRGGCASRYPGIGRIVCSTLAIACAGQLPAADIVTVDDGGVGRNNSIAIGADGLPIIGYRNSGNGSLLIAKCTAADCSTATLETVEDGSGSVARGEYISLAVRANGRPVMAWYDDINNDLSLANCPNPDCADDDVLRTLDPASDDTGRDVSLALDASGRVVVAYVNTTSNALQLARCPVGACLSPSISVIDDDPVNSLGSGAALAIGDDGLPVIAYLDTTADDLRVAKCFDVDCSSGADIHVIDAEVPTTVGGEPDIVIGGLGNPIISYFDEDDLALKVASCNDPDCASAPTISLIDDQPTGDNGRYSAIAVRPDQTPVIAYQRRSLGGAGGSGLRVAECSTLNCTGDVRIVTLDFRAGEITGVDNDIAIGSDGGALVSYYDTTVTSLKLAKCNAQTCVGPGDRLFKDGFQ